MYVSYCKKCNHFFYKSRISNYCKECQSPLIRVPMEKEEFFKLSANERYRLAYKLTNNK
ncbi:MAG: hypothetical protein IJC09_04255 [Clostridia bacterium]|nr:hypothetical protein [Clostridia bacterium]